MSEGPHPAEEFQRLQTVYATQMLEYASALEQAGVYDAMAQFVCHNISVCQEDNPLAANQRVVHLDCGSGGGHMAKEVIMQLQEKGEKFCIVLVEINSDLARNSVERLSALGLPVYSHTHADWHTEFRRPTRSLEVKQSSIDLIDESQDQLVIVVQDDLRSDLKILNAVLQKIAQSDLTPLHTLSFALPGGAYDLSVQETDRLPADWEELLISQYEATLAAYRAVHKLGERFLKKDGSICLINRLQEPTPDQIKRLGDLVGEPIDLGNPSQAEIDYFHDLACIDAAKHLDLQNTFEANVVALLAEDMRDIERKLSIGFFIQNAGDADPISLLTADSKETYLRLLREAIRNMAKKVPDTRRRLVGVSFSKR